MVGICTEWYNGVMSNIMTWLGPREPDCDEMVRYLIRTGEYTGKSRKELMEDAMLKIVSSACNHPIEHIVSLAEKILKHPQVG